MGALVGGHAHDHTIETRPRASADRAWQLFRGLFGAECRFLLGAALGDNKLAFQDGVVAHDDERAGCLCVIQSD